MIRVRLLRVSHQRNGRIGNFIKAPFLKARETVVNTRLAKWWMNKPEKTRKFMLMNGMGILSIYWVFDQGAFYACLPPKPTLPRLREDGTLPPEVLETLSNYQLEEYKNLSSPYSFFPNRYRVWVAEQRMQQGWRVKLHFWREWWNDLQKPEYTEFLPPKLPDAAKITISFDLAILLDSEYDSSYGWRFKLKPGAREFIFILSRAECELVLYTRLDYFSMLVGMADKLAAKFGGLLLLGENCQDYCPEGVNYKLFRNSCQYNMMENVYKKALSKMNRDVSSLIHIDESPMDIEVGYEPNCLFTSDFETFDEREKLIAIARTVLDIIKADPEDVREAIRPISKIYRDSQLALLTSSS